MWIMGKTKYYSSLVICGILFVCLLLLYNGLWNIALYPMSESISGTSTCFINYCMMLTPASAIAASLGGLSILEIVCNITDSKWKSVAEMILWSLLTILLNSYTAYLISKSMENGIESIITIILIGTTVINIIWYVLFLSVLKQSKYWNRIMTVFEKEEPDNKDEVKIMESKETNTAKLQTKTFVHNLLVNIGCIPNETEEGRIKFDYQGVTFLIEAVEECLFVNLIWPWCHSFSKFDIDEFARVRQVVNDINMRGTVSVFYGITDSDEVALHIKKHFLLVPQIPDSEEYIKLILESFFRTARTLDLEIEKCRMQECSK